MEKYFDNLTNKYGVTKMLRFALKPIGNTRETIRKNLILERDVKIAAIFPRVKELITDVHKSFIDDVLKNTEVSVDLLKEIYGLQDEIDSDEKYEKIQARLRKELSSSFTGHPFFEKLFGKELFSTTLPSFVKSEDDLSAVFSFEGRTTLFNMFNAEKKRMYSDENKHFRIPFRLINENLPRFMDNIRIFGLLGEKKVYSVAGMEELERELDIAGFSSFFEPEGFNLVLTQEGIDTYNQLIGGISTKDGRVQGLNEYINLWNQRHPNERKLPYLTQLYKQLLSGNTTCSFVVNAFHADEEVLDALSDSNEVLMTRILTRTDGMSFPELFKNIEDFDLDGIYIRTSDVRVVSQFVCGRWNALDDAFSKMYDTSYTGKKQFGTEKYEEEKRKALGKIKARSLTEIIGVFKENSDKSPCFIDWIKNQAVVLVGDVKYKASVLLEMVSTHKKETPIRQRNDLVDAIKDYLDAVKDLWRFLKLFAGGNSTKTRDMAFHAEFNAMKDYFLLFDDLYNMVRNYVIKKAFSDDKVRLVFNKPSLLSGWSVTKESENFGMILRKGENLYLGIAQENSSDIFAELSDDSGSGDGYEKMEYRLLPDPSKMLPKVCFSQKNAVVFQPSDEVLNIRSAGTFKKGAEFSLSDCHKLIDFYKDCISKYEAWEPFGFRFSPTETYQNISDFYNEVEEQGYKVTFRSVAADTVDRMVEDGRLYLFQIWCKDFAPGSTGNLDAQTVYLKMLFDKRNLSDVVYKLCGGAEVFYRPKGLELEHTAIHKANEPVANKNPRNEKKSSTFSYDIIKDRRYTDEGFFLHLPVAMNLKATGNTYSLNMEIDDGIRNAKDQHIIGINRGERNLLQVVVINSKGEIKEQFSLNTVENVYMDADGNARTILTDYHELLDRREKERDAAQAKWRELESIKNLKKGYLGQVVRVIASLAIKYNALIVMEDLSSVFVNRRKKIEKSVYQEFEAALLKKLGYLLIDKKRDLANVEAPGGALKAYQLAGPVVSFDKIGYRNGIVFYVSPWNVSNMDPTTGFAKHMSFRYENMAKAKKFISCFDSIRYNAEKDFFEFAFDYKNFGVKFDGCRTEWTVCTYGRRLERFKNPDKNDMKDTRDYYPTEELKQLFKKYHISYSTGDCVLEQLLCIGEAAFYKELLHIFAMTMQMYNYSEGFGTGNEEFFQSCVANSCGEFYNSLAADISRPQCSDAIAAYHIAKKGLLLVERIKEASEGDKISLVVRNEEWMNYIQRTL